jgi:hypothetical protein
LDFRFHVSSCFRAAATAVCLALSANGEVAVARSCNAPKTASVSADPRAAGVSSELRFICPAHGIVVIQCWTDDKIVLAVQAGTPVRAVGAGTVSYAGDFGRFGHVIVVKHPHGFASVYGHVGTFEVTRGDRVGAGQVIATMAAEEGTLGSELVFQLLDRGKAVVQGRYLGCP